MQEAFSNFLLYLNCCISLSIIFYRFWSILACTTKPDFTVCVLWATVRSSWILTPLNHFNSSIKNNFLCSLYSLIESSRGGWRFEYSPQIVVAQNSSDLLDFNLLHFHFFKYNLKLFNHWHILRLRKISCSIYIFKNKNVFVPQDYSPHLHSM